MIDAPPRVLASSPRPALRRGGRSSGARRVSEVWVLPWSSGDQLIGPPDAATRVGPEVGVVSDEAAPEPLPIAPPANCLALAFARVPGGLHVASGGRVRLLPPSFVADFPVTNAQWAEFIRMSGYDGEPDCPGIDAYRVYDGRYLAAYRSGRPGFSDPDRPVVCVSWFNARALARWLTAHERAAGRIDAQWEYALPTEVEWEHRALAGADSRYWYGPAPDPMKMNFDVPDGHPNRRGVFPANPWGLFDVHGNVFEWCDNLASPGLENRPSGDIEPGYRSNRGGSWASPAESCAATYRHWNAPESCHNRLGIRLVLREPGGVMAQPAIRAWVPRFLTRAGIPVRWDAVPTPSRLLLPRER